MNDVNNERFSGALYALPKRIADCLLKLPLFLKNEICEIRLRLDKPLCLTATRSFYVSEDSVASTDLPEKPLVVSKSELEEVVLRITERSVYARTKELENGYLSMRKGCRAGVCGNVLNGNFSLTSINIRIAREFKGSADKLLPLSEKGLIIAGPPGSGKTTLLRDLVRQISNSGKRVCVVDTRGEICGGVGKEGLDVGVNTDVINGFEKADGAEIALRTMFPDYIAFDEVANEKELKLIKESFFSGVSVLTTVHAGSLDDLKIRSVTSDLLNGPTENIVLLNPIPGKGFSVISNGGREACLKP